MPLLDTFLIVQKYVTALLFLLIALSWFQLKKEGIEDFFRKPLVIRFLLFLGFPFIVLAVPQFSSLTALFVESIGVILFSTALFIVSFIEFKNVDTKRLHDLQDLMDKPKHPIALEFARKIVEPEIAFLHKEERRLRSFEKSVHSRLKKKEQDLDIKVKTDAIREKKLKEQEAKTAHELEDLRKKKKLLSTQEKEFNHQKEEIEDKKEEIDVLHSRLEKLKEKDKQRKKELKKERKELDIEKKNIDEFKKNIKKQEDIFAKNEKMKEYLEKRKEELKQKEKEMRERFVGLEDREEDIDDDKNEIAAQRRKLDAEKAKLDALVESYNKKRSELLILENQLDDRKEDLERLEKILAKKEKELDLEKGELIRKQREMMK